MRWLWELKTKVVNMKYSSTARCYMQEWGLLYMQDPKDTRKGDLDHLIEIAERAKLLCDELDNYEVLPGEYDDLVDSLSDEWVKP